MDYCVRDIFATLGKPTEEEYQVLPSIFRKNLKWFKLDFQKRQIIQHWKKHVRPTNTVEDRLNAIADMEPLLIRAFHADFPNEEPDIRNWIRYCLISSRLCRCNDFPYWMELWLWYRYWRAYTQALKELEESG